MPRRNYSRLKIGREVKSLKDWCAIKGVDPRRARQRMTDLGWSPAEAVELKPRVIDREALHAAAFPDEPISLTYERKTKTLREWHKETGIPERTLYDRYRKGWDSADILDPERHNSRNKRRERVMREREIVALRAMIDRVREDLDRAREDSDKRRVKILEKSEKRLVAELEKRNGAPLDEKDDKDIDDSQKAV